ASCPDLPAHRAGHWLARAGKYSLEQLNDAAAAERYLAQALRKMPKDPTIADAYRVAAARAAQPRLTAAGARTSHQDVDEAFGADDTTADERSENAFDVAPKPSDERPSVPGVSTGETLASDARG